MAPNNQLRFFIVVNKDVVARGGNAGWLAQLMIKYSGDSQLRVGNAGDCRQTEADCLALFGPGQPPRKATIFALGHFENGCLYALKIRPGGAGRIIASVLESLMPNNPGLLRELFMNFDVPWHPEA